MAARVLHLTIAKILSDQLMLKDELAFQIGHLVPDAIAYDSASHAISHYKENAMNDTKKLMNYYAFRDQFAESILNDDLKLGYFFHLVQDAIYRKFLYIDYDFNKFYGETFRMALYKDYQIMNGYLVNKYDLQKVSVYSNDQIAKDINDLHPFNIEAFIGEVNGDFDLKVKGTTSYFTEKMADEYLQIAVKTCLKEYEALKKGVKVSNPLYYAWNKV